MTNFYDKVANKFGKYSSGIKCTDDFLNGNPEEDFKKYLIGYSGKDKKALDVGCADGRFTLSVADNFGEIVAIDNSSGMLNSAKELQNELNITNVKFENKNAHNTGFENQSFDIVYSRRGPTNYNEFARLLKRDGYYLEIQIGEKDTKDIKIVFGRGQNFGDWGKSRLEINKKEIELQGFEIIFAKDYEYNEYYSTKEDLDTFLQSVPIFEDFDSVKDKELLDKYVSKFKTEKGIKLPRHRIVILAKLTK